MNSSSSSSVVVDADDVDEREIGSTTITTNTNTNTNTKLNDSVMIAPGVMKPRITFGTGGGMYGKRAVVEQAVVTWLSPEVGGRSIDTAINYGNDDLVGAAITASQLPREDIFLTTKQPGPLGYVETIAALQQALVRMQTSYVDLYLIHYPNPKPDANNTNNNKTGTELRQETWKGMEEVLRRGWTRSIGVSNYKISDLQDTLEVATIPPAINQVLWNPALHEDALLDYCRHSNNNITLEAWSPLGGSQNRHGQGKHILELPLLKYIAAAHNVTTAQIVLRWILQHPGSMTLATSTTKKKHMQTDLEVFGFQLTDAEMVSISNIQNTTTTATTTTTTTTTNSSKISHKLLRYSLPSFDSVVA